MSKPIDSQTHSAPSLEGGRGEGPHSRTLKDWIIATRPGAVPASSSPIIAMSCYFFYLHAFAGEPFDWVVAVLALPMMMLFQASGNLISDAADHEHAVDLPGSLNGVRHIQDGKFTAHGSRHYGFSLLAVAAVIGMLILWRMSALYSPDVWQRLVIVCAIIGMTGIALAVWYPYIKYHALGDLDILLCYALLPAAGLDLSSTGLVHPHTLLLCLPFGLQTVAILHANNTRDIRNDRRAGIHTLPHLIGGKASQWLYAAEVLVPYVLIAVYFLLGFTPAWTLLAWLIFPIAVKNARWMMSVPAEEEQGIALLDQKTAQMQLFTGLLYALGFLIGACLA